MATKTFCDRCEREIRPAYTKTEISLESKKKFKWNREVCDRCDREFEEWWAKK